MEQYTIENILDNIALTHFPAIETMEEQYRDSLDFHSVSVMQIRSALESAFNAGTRYAIDTLTLGAQK